MDAGLLLSLPLESIAIRAVLATLAAVLLVRCCLRVGLRSGWARVATALAPGAALVVVVVATGSAVQPPVLMLPSEGAGALPIPVRDGFLYFAPLAVPILVGVWALVVAWRLSRRTTGMIRARREALLAVANGRADVSVTAVARRLADRLGVARPLVALVPTCPGGAFVVGRSRPVIVLGEDLRATLDDEELEGVLAHELAHVRRRDNLVAAALGMVRDTTFFVPGGGWAVRQLHRERELAADQSAAAATGRPAALASGLLKVMETVPEHARACAPFAPTGGLVGRVNVLLDDTPPPGRARRSVEVLAVVVVVAIAAGSALAIPAALAGESRERDQLALVWSATPPVSLAETATQAEARVFSAYRRAHLDVATPTLRSAGTFVEDSQENRRAALHACAAEDRACPVPARTPGLGIRPPTITVDESLNRRWDAVPVAGGAAGDGFRLYWLAQRPE